MSEWIEKFFEEVCFVDKECLPANTDVNFNFLYISLSDVQNGKILPTAEKITFRNAPSRARRIVHSNDIIMATVRPNLQAFAFIKEIINNTIASTGFAVLSRKDKYSTEYIYHYLFSHHISKQINSLVVGSNYPAINSSDVKKLKIKMPHNYQHQLKIARILTTVDNIIEKTEVAIAKYKAIKQGMMHDLFTRGINVKTGKLRPAFDDAPELYKKSELGMIPKEWEVSYLCDLSENLDGKRVPIKQSDRDKMEGNIPYYGASGIIDYVNDYIFDEPLILLGEDGENVISRNLPLAFKIEGKSWVNNHAHVLKPNKDMSIDFLIELLESLDYKDVISGSAQPKINQNNLSQKSLIKPNIREQKIIVNIIYSINSMIQDEKQAFRKYQKLKQGLMQNILTGKKEVTPDAGDFDSEQLIVNSEK